MEVVHPTSSDPIRLSSNWEARSGRQDDSEYSWVEKNPRFRISEASTLYDYKYQLNCELFYIDSGWIVIRFHQEKP